MAAAGLLVAAPAPSDTPSTGHEARAGAPLHLRAGDPWAGLQRDGRRPISFVSHQVDHLPLALGMLRALVLAHDNGALLQHYFPLPIVRGKRATTAGRQARFGDNVPRTARPGLVACRWRSA